VFFIFFMPLQVYIGFDKEEPPKYVSHLIHAGMTVPLVSKSFVDQLATLVDLVMIPTCNSSLIALDFLPFASISAHNN
jgi:hypothetical protein